MTTSLRILGKDYDLEDATQKVSLNVLVFMKKRLGVTLKDIVGGLQQIDAGGDPLDLLADENGLDSIRGLIWLARTEAGERAPDGKFFTLDEASEGIGFFDMEWVNADGETDPKDAEVEALSSSTISK